MPDARKNVAEQPRAVHSLAVITHLLRGLMSWQSLPWPLQRQMTCTFMHAQQARYLASGEDPGPERRVEKIEAG